MFKFFVFKIKCVGVIRGLAVFLLFWAMGTMSAAAVTVTVNVDPAGTYLTPSTSDPANAPTEIDLVALGIQAGDIITLNGSGDYENIVGFGDVDYSLVAVFQGASGFLSPGPSSTVSMPYFSTISDIAEDFFVTTTPRQAEVPAGATKLLLNVNDTFYSENSDPDGDFAVVITFTPTAGGSVRQRTQRTIVNFMSRRADQITANDPNLAQRLTQTGNTGGAPINFTGSGTLDNNRLAFSSSLRQMLASKKASETAPGKDPSQMMALGQGSLVSYGEPTSGFDVWVQGKWAHVDDDTRKNDIGLMYLGVDYRMSANLVVGFLAQMDRVDEKDSTQSTAVDGTGWLAGPYVVARLHENLIFDARAAWGQSSNDVELTGTSSGSFDTTRWLARARMTGDFKHGLWHFAPHVGVIYFEDRQDTFTDSLGNVIAGQTVSLGRLTFGPKISYSMRSADGTVVTPHLAISGIWDFNKAEIVDVSTGLAAGSDDLRGQVEGGVSVRMANGWSVSGAGFYDGIGANELDIFGGSVKVSVPLN
jgi:outer membrane autotransporter protein